MNEFKFELDRAGVKQLLKGPEMQNHIKAEAEAVAARAGEGNEAEVKVGQNRAYANIWAESFPARVRNNKDNTLLKALGQ